MMDRLNEMEILQTHMYTNKNCGIHIRAVPEIHDWRELVNNQYNLIDTIHPNSVKEL